MTTYDFRTQLQDGQQGEAALDAHFAQWFTITPASDAEQRAGIDRHWYGREDARHWTVEYKTDHIAHRTNNAFVETVSVEGQRRGWVYTSTAAWLVYYIPGGVYNLAYLMDIAYIRRTALRQWELRYPVRMVRNVGYVTKGLLVPLYEFESRATQVCQL